LRNRKIRYRSIICTQRAFIWWQDCENRSSISEDIRPNTPVFFGRVSYQTFTNELCQLWSYWTEVHENFTQYRGIIYAVNEVAISHSISKCQSDETGEFPIFSQNWLPWQRHLRCQKRGPDQSSAPKTLSLCVKIAKIGPADNCSPNDH